MQKSGVYRITNTVTGKYYLGSSIEMTTRWKTHRRYLRRGNHWNILLQRSWDKHGESVFTFTIQEEFYGTKDELRAREQFYLDTVDRTVSLNLSFVACGPDTSTAAIEKRKRFGERHFHHDPTIFTLKNVFTNEAFEGIKSVFRRKYQLDSGRVGLLLAGRAKSYKGWVLATSNHVPIPVGANGKDLRQWTFVNDSTSEIFVGTQSDMYKKLGRGQRHINSLVRGYSKSYHGWTVRRC